MADRQVEVRSVSISSDDNVLLSGTAVVPTGDGSVPGVLLLSGSGPLDRDSNMPGQHLDISSTLAEALGAGGVASLRFDKRGVAASSGDFVSTGFDAETNDAATAFGALSDIDGIDSERIGVVGHSVGATIAARLGADSESVAFAVLLGCAASSGAEVMAWQTGRIAEGLRGPSWALGRRFRRKQARIFERLDASTDEMLGSGNEAVPAKWMREYRAHDPLADLAALRCPVLAITGGKDIQVNPAELVQIEAAVMGPCTTLILSDLTHVLRTSIRKPSINRYRELLQQPVDNDLVETITTWTISHTNPAPGNQSGPSSCT